MKIIALCLTLCLDLLVGFAQEKPAYRIFSSDGQPVSYRAMVDAIQVVDIAFFGKLHGNPIAHWLELELAKGLFALRGKDLVLGVEMFESDNQLIMDEYLAGLVPPKRFEEEARLWNNYKTDYRLLVEFARATTGLGLWPPAFPAGTHRQLRRGDLRL